MMKKVYRRFVSKVLLGNDRGCWIWAGARNQCGYGSFGENGRTYLAHRWFWQHFNGDPGAQRVLHTCDTPACVNLAHLYLGSQKDNAGDRERKGRGNHPKGELHGRATLTVRQVLAIRQSTASHTLEAQVHGVSRTLVRKIREGELWV